ncbi:hypothetical protein [Photobacterium leiognathi]|uniref:hypothetical protein n=1 Tax=Photobacterium leiognathi TaxID=553611 RepID=UPI00298203E4|nr:hypothetical protein [Photobacterium leiognathi]
MTVSRLPLALILAATTLTGCASWLPSSLSFGGDESNSTWVGEYQSAPEMGLTTHLSLKGDHTATTTYEYTNGDPSLKENGNWQALSDTQLQVNMTSHHGLNSERIYTFDPSKQQLTATEETVNGQKYHLGTNGLVLTKQD